MVDVMICAQSAQVAVDEGARLEWVRADRTVAHADHPVVVEYPHLWRKLEINYPSPTVDVENAARTGESVSSKPSARDVRSWAKEQGIDIPARGPIPDDVIEQYTEAQVG